MELNSVFERLSVLINQYYEISVRDSVIADDRDDRLASCVSHLECLGNIFLIVHLPEAQVFCRTLEDVCYRLRADGADRIKLCQTLGAGVIMLQRYVDFVARMQRSVPPLLVALINDVRMALGKRVIEEGFFTRLSLHELARLNQLSPRDPDSGTLVQMRQSYQQGLLLTLRNQQRVGLRLLKRVVQRLMVLYQGSPIAIVWESLSVVLEGFLQDWLRLTQHRTNVLVRAERVLSLLAVGDYTSQSLVEVKSVLRDVLFLVALCQRRHAGAARIAAHFELESVDYTDQFLAQQGALLLGPDSQTFEAFFDQLNRLIALTRSQLTELLGGWRSKTYSELCDSLDRLISLLTVIEANQWRDVLRDLASQLEQQQSPSLCLANLVDALVGVESEIQFRQLSYRPNRYLGVMDVDALDASQSERFYHASAQKQAVVEVLNDVRWVIQEVEALEFRHGLRSANWPAMLSTLQGCAQVLQVIGLDEPGRCMAQVADHLQRLIRFGLLDTIELMEEWATALAAIEYHCAGLISPKIGWDRALGLVGDALNRLWVQASAMNPTIAIPGASPAPAMGRSAVVLH